MGLSSLLIMGMEVASRSELGRSQNCFSVLNVAKFGGLPFVGH